MDTMNSIRQVDVQAMCRLCLADHMATLKSVFEENQLALKIELLLQLEISKQDKVSTMICNDCIIRLDTWFAYKKQCHKNQTKLQEWLNIHNSSASDELDTDIKIKEEPTDFVKTETNVDSPYSNGNSSRKDSLYGDEDDADILDSMDTLDDRRCPECSRVFGSALNRRRHQIIAHENKERRCPMIEIRTDAKEKLTSSSESATFENTEEPSNDVDSKGADTTHDLNMDTDSGDQSKPTTNEGTDANVEMDPNINSTTTEGNESIEMAVEEDITPYTSKQETLESTNEENNCETHPDLASKQEEPPKKIETDEKKIEFAAGLRLVQRDVTQIENEPLSKIEHSYIEKCKAMVSMFQTMQCACHNSHHKSVRNMLSHLRETRIWFPVFTCYNCMISLTDRSTFTRHYTRCTRPQMEALRTLSNLRRRSEIKSRLYQNFKCNRCKFLFSFHEDYCKHVDECHAQGTAPFYCSCRTVFDRLEEYKEHCYTSCLLSYYCDVCFKTTSTVEEFVKHAQEAHDNSEGFMLLQQDSYSPRQHLKHKEADDESNVVECKRERRQLSKESVSNDTIDKDAVTDLKDFSISAIRKMIQLDTNVAGWSKTPAKCPICNKQYSTVNNMIRHYKSHIEKREVQVPKKEVEEIENNEDLYTCPDCDKMYPESQWQQHLDENHPMKSCAECGKEFQFQRELDHHRSAHLNLKVYRDSKTHSYKSAIISPTAEKNDTSNDVMIMCEFCDTIFTNKDELHSHKLTHHDAPDSGSSSVDDYDVDMKIEPSIIEDTKDILQTPVKDNDEPYCDQCNKPFASKKSLNNHIVNFHGAEYVKKNEYPKKCSLCSKTCSTGAAYKGHMQMHERNSMSEKDKQDKARKCEYCGKICSTGSGLYLHIQMHERVTLGELKKRKDDKKKPELLVVKEEDDSYHTCRKCFKVFAAKGRLKEHLKSHGIFLKGSPTKKSRKVLCDLCHVALDSYEALAEHKADEHNDECEEEKCNPEPEDDIFSESADTEMFTCQICQNNFVSKTELVAHEKTHHTKNNSTLCKHCRITFQNTMELVKHMHEEHGDSAKPKTVKTKPKGVDKPYCCPYCSKTFASYGAMTAHSGWHKRGSQKLIPISNNPQQNIAAKIVRKQNAIKKLAATTIVKSEPIEIPEFQCTTCFMELPNHTALQIHVLEKHGNLDNIILVPRCDTCNLEFSSNEEYEKHKRFHLFLERQVKHENSEIQTPIIQSVETVIENPQSNLKKFSCSWCPAMFSRQDTLNTHVRRNHAEHSKTEFSCDICERVFEKQNALTIHAKVHMRPTNPIHEQPRSSKSQNSAQHSSSAPGKMYICSLCNAGFTYPKDLRQHTIQKHPF